MKRIFDFMFSLLFGIFLAIPIIIIAVFVKSTSKGQVLHWSDRVGRDNVMFSMPKFRTMKIYAPAVATHLLNDPDQYITSVGRFLRKFSLDEMPQIYSVLKGDMSLVGPRPALFNQDDLIVLRTQKGVHKLMPGITGWAQINGRDDLPIPAKVEMDEYYLNHRSFFMDIKTLFITFSNVLHTKGIKH